MPADRSGSLTRGGSIDVKQCNLGASRGEALCGRSPNGAAGAGYRGNLSGQRRLFAGAKLGLLERPIFAIEHVGFGDRFKPADRFGAGQAFDPGLGDVGSNDGVLPGAAEAVASARAEGGGGLFAGAGGIMGVGSRLMSAGLDMGEIQGVTRELIAYARDKAGDRDVNAIVEAIPGLSQFI